VDISGKFDILCYVKLYMEKNIKVEGIGCVVGCDWASFYCGMGNRNVSFGCVNGAGS